MSDLDIKSVIDLTRTLEKDHNPYGYPCVRMREMTALADEVENLEKENAELKNDLDYANKEVSWLLNSITGCDSDKINDLKCLMANALEKGNE